MGVASYLVSVDTSLPGHPVPPNPPATLHGGAGAMSSHGQPQLAFWRGGGVCITLLWRGESGPTQPTQSVPSWLAHRGSRSETSYGNIGRLK